MCILHSYVTGMIHWKTGSWSEFELIHLQEELNLHSNKAVFIRICCQFVYKAAGEPELSVHSPKTAVLCTLPQDQSSQHSWLCDSLCRVPYRQSPHSPWLTRKISISRLQLLDPVSKSRVGQGVLRLAAASCSSPLLDDRAKPPHSPEVIKNSSAKLSHLNLKIILNWCRLTGV